MEGFDRRRERLHGSNRKSRQTGEEAVCPRHAELAKKNYKMLRLSSEVSESEIRRVVLMHKVLASCIYTQAFQGFSRGSYAQEACLGELQM